jgi:DNA-directed RNA polymerase subunit M/transcription elongation factor TFIIS
MATPGSAEESLRLAEHYRGLCDEELIALAQQIDKLTEQAQRALEMEIFSRKLTFPPREPHAPHRPALPETGGEEDSYSGEIPDEDDPYAEDRKLFEICKVWSEADARRLQYVLDVAGLPFYIGRENATSVDDVTAKFEEGVSVKVMRIGLPWAYDAMWRNYFPQDERPEPKYEDAGDFAIQCPRCRSTEVVFHERIDRAPGAGAKYRWTCASCGYEWEDDGAETKK